ncbi:MAG: hypothetical protein RLZZ379_465, partial [Pseudomonadota bacterium]
LVALRLARRAQGDDRRGAPSRPRRGGRVGQGRAGCATDSLVSGGCLISGSTVDSSVLFSDVRVHSYCKIEGTVILPKVTVNRHVVLKNAVIDRGCVIPEGMQIGVDLALDAKRFYVSEKGITLVTPDMLGQDLYRVV